jgi:hypothetical protein
MEKSPCEKLDDMIRDEHDAQPAYHSLWDALMKRPAWKRIDAATMMMTVIQANITDENKHEKMLETLKTVYC